MSTPCFVGSATSFTISGQPGRRAISTFAGSGLQWIEQPKLQYSAHIARGVRRDKGVWAPISMKSEASSMSPVTRIASFGLAAALVFATFLPLVGVIRNGVSDNGQLIVDSQLGKVPIFTVTDESGRPFLSETEDHRLRRGYFFIQPVDAQNYLQRVTKDGGSNAKVLTIGLNEAVKFLERSSPGNSIPERFELFPDEHEAEIAQAVTEGAFQKTFGASAVPIFYIDGLGIKDSKEGETVFPLFFEKEKLDETVNNLKKTDPKATIDLKDTQVIDLRQTVREIRAGSNPNLNRVVFVPLSESLNAMRNTAGE